MSENQTPPPAGEVKILVDTGELKIGIPVRAALAIHRYNIIGWTIFLFFAIGMMNYGFYYEHDIERYISYHNGYTKSFSLCVVICNFLAPLYGDLLV